MGEEWSCTLWLMYDIHTACTWVGEGVVGEEWSPLGWCVMYALHCLYIGGVGEEWSPCG